MLLLFGNNPSPKIEKLSLVKLLLDYCKSIIKPVVFLFQQTQSSDSEESLQRKLGLRLHLYPFFWLLRVKWTCFL